MFEQSDRERQDDYVFRFKQGSSHDCERGDLTRWIQKTVSRFSALFLARRTFLCDILDDVGAHEIVHHGTVDSGSRRGRVE